MKQQAHVASNTYFFKEYKIMNSQNQGLAQADYASIIYAKQKHLGCKKRARQRKTSD